MKVHSWSKFHTFQSTCVYVCVWLCLLLLASWGFPPLLVLGWIFFFSKWTAVLILFTTCILHSYIVLHIGVYEEKVHIRYSVAGVLYVILRKVNRQYRFYKEFSPEPFYQTIFLKKNVTKIYMINWLLGHLNPFSPFSSHVREELCTMLFSGSYLINLVNIIEMHFF